MDTIPRKLFVFSVCAFVLLFGLAQQSAYGQQNVEDVPTLEELKQGAVDLKRSFLTATREERLTLAQETQQMLSRFDARIAALRQNIDQRQDDMTSAARRYSEELLDKLAEQRADVMEWLENIETSSAREWDHTVYNFNTAYDAFFESWEDVESHFGLEQ